MKTAAKESLLAERKEISDSIEEICKSLQGPWVSNLERRLLHEDRKDMRARIREIDELLEKEALDTH